MEIIGNEEVTPIVDYTPDAIDEYLVVVNLPEDWTQVHNYIINENEIDGICLLYTSPSPRDLSTSRMPSSA